MTEPLIERLRTRAEIRRKLIHQQVRKEPDRIADILEEAASEIERLRAALTLSCYCNDPAYRSVEPCAACEALAAREPVEGGNG